MICSFEPIIDQRCKAIILGTFPGIESLRNNQYYANNKNQFWKLIYNIFDRPIPDEKYTDRKNFILKNSIGLWDVIGACERKGSLDSNIKNPILNDFNNLFIEYTNISHIFFNGGVAAKHFNLIPLLETIKLNLNYYKLPSSSPTNTMSFDKKLLEWKLIKYLGLP